MLLRRRSLMMNQGFEVEWNQLVQNGNFADGTTNINYQNVIEHSVSNNVLTFTALGDWQGGIQMAYYPVSPVPDTKFYGYCFVKGEPGKTFVARGHYFSYGTVILNGEWQRAVGFGNKPSDNGWMNFACNASSAPCSLQLKNVVWMNLTKMFGTGNEPTTAAEFEAWLIENGINPNEYIPYNAGEKRKMTKPSWL